MSRVMVKKAAATGRGRSLFAGRVLAAVAGMDFLQGYARYLPAVLRSHFTGVRVEDPVAAAGWLGTAPTRFTTMSGGLTVFFVRTHDALSTVTSRRKRYFKDDTLRPRYKRK